MPLLKTVFSQFGRVTLADGSRLFAYDQERTGRITWKIIRGLYTLETKGFLPEGQLKTCTLLDPATIDAEADRFPWCRTVLATPSLGRYQAIFDYKWLGAAFDGMKANLIAFLLWDRLVFLSAFHDSTCACSDCQEYLGPGPPRQGPREGCDDHDDGAPAQKGCMSTWDERMTPRPRPAPRLERLETCWRARSPTGRVLECGLYRTDAGLEVRMGYGEQLLASRYRADVEIAHATAELWRQAALENPRFEELPRAVVASIEPSHGGRVVRREGKS